MALQQILCARVVHLMSPSFCVQVEGEVTGCVGQEGSFSVKVVFSESSDSLFILLKKGWQRAGSHFLLFFQLIWLVTAMCTPSPDRKVFTTSWCRMCACPYEIRLVARLVGLIGTSRGLYWGLKSTRNGLESGTDSDPCGTASGVGNSHTSSGAGFMCMLWEHPWRAGAVPAE